VTTGTVQAIHFKGVRKIYSTFYIFHTIKYDIGVVKEDVMSDFEGRENLHTTVKVIIY